MIYHAKAAKPQLDDDDYDSNEDLGDEDIVVDDEEEEDDTSEEDDMSISETTLELFPSLQEPTFKAYKAKTLYRMVADGRIDLSPDYQRDEVWNKKAKAGVVVSYLQGYQVPPIVLRKMADGTYECIDGKQRLISLCQFFSGEVPISSPGVKKRYWYVRNAENKGGGGTLLPALFRWKAGNMKIHVTEFNDLTDGETREMFKRVQAGKVLNLAEKLHAIDSTWANYIKELDKGMNKHFWEVIFFRNHRMASFLSLVRIVSYLTRLGYPSSRLVGLPEVPAPDELIRWITREPKVQDAEDQMEADIDPGDWPVPIDGPTERFQSWMTVILDKFQAIGSEEEYHQVAFCPIRDLPIGRNLSWHSKNYPTGAKSMTMSPVEVVCTCLYIARNTDLEPATLARGIQNIRNLIYERFAKERKLNKFTMQHFWSWLLNHDGDGGAADDYQTPPPVAGPAPVETHSPQRRKRTMKGADSAPGSSKKKRNTAHIAAVTSGTGEQSSTDPEMINEPL